MERGDTPLVAALLLNYLSQLYPDQAQAIYEIPAIQTLISTADYRHFEALAAQEMASVADVLDRMIREFDISNEMMDLIVSTHQNQMISFNDLERIKRSLIEQIKTVMNGEISECICLKENEPLLRKSIQIFRAIRELCVGRRAVEDALDQAISEFQSIYVLDLEHLTRPQYDKGQISGLHDRPDNDHENYELENDGNIEVRLMYPRLLTPTMVVAAYKTNITTQKEIEFRSKMSTFPKETQTEMEQLRMIESVLLHPTNDPSADGSILQRRHFGLDAKGDPRVVWTHENTPGTKRLDPDGVRRIGTSFPFPFFDSTDPKSRSASTLSRLEVVHEQGLDPVPVPPGNPQERLIGYLLQNIAMPDEGSYNRNITALQERIVLLLSQPDAPFRIMPTCDDRPFLVQTSLRECGLESLPNILKTGCSAVSGAMSQTKRITDRHIDAVFSDKANGVSVIIQFPSFESFAKMIYRAKEDELSK